MKKMKLENSGKNTGEGITPLREEKIEYAKSLIAVKDFELHHNDFHRVIKKGDFLSDIPKEFLENLKTEGVI